MADLSKLHLVDEKAVTADEALEAVATASKQETLSDKPAERFRTAAKAGTTAAAATNAEDETAAAARNTNVKEATTTATAARIGSATEAKECSNRTSACASSRISQPSSVGFGNWYDEAAIRVYFQASIHAFESQSVLVDMDDTESVDMDNAASDESTDDGNLCEVLEPYQLTPCRCPQPT